MHLWLMLHCLFCNGSGPAAGFVGMLDDPDDTIKAFALTKLNTMVDQFWAEVADSLTKMYVDPVLSAASRGAWGRRA